MKSTFVRRAACAFVFAAALAACEASESTGPEIEPEPELTGTWLEDRIWAQEIGGTRADTLTPSSLSFAFNENAGTYTITAGEDAQNGTFTIVGDSIRFAPQGLDAYRMSFVLTATQLRLGLPTEWDYTGNGVHDPVPATLVYRLTRQVAQP